MEKEKWYFKVAGEQKTYGPMNPPETIFEDTIGPFESEEEAEKARKESKKKDGLNYCQGYYQKTAYSCYKE